MAAKRRQGLLDNFFTIVSKMPKDECLTFLTSTTIRFPESVVFFGTRQLDMIN